MTFVNKMLQCSPFFNERIWIIRFFQTHCQLPKFKMRDIPFNPPTPPPPPPTTTTTTTHTPHHHQHHHSHTPAPTHHPLVNVQGLVDSASLKNDENINNVCNSGGYTWLKTFGGLHIIDFTSCASNHTLPTFVIYCSRNVFIHLRQNNYIVLYDHKLYW